VIFVSRMETVVHASTIHTHRDVTRHVMIENATKKKHVFSFGTDKDTHTYDA
jgi:hypothetical protein